MRVAVCTTLAEFDSLKSDWQGLEQAVGGALLPFQTYAWNRAWWDAFARHTPIRNDLLQILAFHDEDSLVAVFPLFETAAGLGHWRPLRYLRPFGADPNLTEIRTPLALPHCLPAVLDRALEFLSAPANAPWMLQLVGPAAAIEAAAQRHGHLRSSDSRHVCNYVLPLAGDWDSFRGGLKRNIKESLRRCYNSLKREGLAHDLLVIDDIDEIRRHQPAFYRMHGQRAAVMSSSVIHPDYFASARHRAFIESAIAGLGAGGRRYVHLFCLRVGNQVVAMRLGFRSGNDVYLYYSGYDPAYARFSVMTTLLAETFRWCIEQGVSTVNLSIGTDVSKTRWGPEAVSYQETHFVRATGTGWLAQWLLRVRRSALAGARGDLAPSPTRNSGPPAAS